MKTIIIIPARMGSSRFPGKPLAPVNGIPLVHWTYNQARRLSNLVIVATPDREIAHYCEKNNLAWRPTMIHHPTGTHRAAEVIRQMRDGAVGQKDLVINWQVDEPFVDPNDVAQFNRRFGFKTLFGELRDHLLFDSNLVKVAVGDQNRCLWFSRAPMRGAKEHIGVYGFEASKLIELEKIEPTSLSKAESLEQLTWIEKLPNDWITGFPIEGEIPLSINTPEDLELMQEIVGNAN